MDKFSEIEQKAIKEKYRQLLKVSTEVLWPKDLAESITLRRVKWINEHLGEMLEKYEDLPILEKAYRIIYFEHMKINPQYSKMYWIKHNQIRIDSYNFRPYLEACKKLELDTKFVCKDILEPGINEMIKIIHPDLVFYRNYDNIRPGNNKDFCEEYIEFLKT